jgi:hypothetical protein
LGWITLVAASLLNSNIIDDGASLLRDDNYCVTPQVRREWRALSDGEKAEWIGAVKVSLSSDELGRAFPSLEPFPTTDVQSEHSAWQKSRTGDMSSLTRTM